ncbi:hypothetical protein [Cesiribacter sp. SM1]|nr:hypothetical protein [Cesiribacter sp. SM1]
MLKSATAEDQEEGIGVALCQLKHILQKNRTAPERSGAVLF